MAKPSKCRSFLLLILFSSIQRTIGFSHQRYAQNRNFYRVKGRSFPVLFSVTDSSLDSAAPYKDVVAQTTTTVVFPPYSELMKLDYGQYAISDLITVTSADKTASFDFQVKLYPRGGGHPSQHSVFSKDKQKSGFGMSYAVLPMFGRSRDEKVGVYLQYLPRQQNASVDASFGLRIVGKQSQGPRFDVEWRSGMRFVSLQESKLMQGRANDFGAHLMQTPLLHDFLGADETDTSVEMHVDITIHKPPEDNAVVVARADTGENASAFSSGFGLLGLHDIRLTSDPNEHDTSEVRVGRVVVPILRKLSQRPRMFQLGAYPGVEYRILRIVDPDTEHELFYSRPGADYYLKPIYPLVAQLERPWPVRVNEKDIPKLYTPAMYNTVSAIGSLLTAITGLLTAFLVSQAVSIFFIPSRSMDPTLQVGDVLLVDKVTPRIFKGNKIGDVVLFHPPQKLLEIVEQSGGRITDRDLFVKRIAAEPGDRISVERTGAVKINGEMPTGRRDLCTAEPLRLIERYIQPADDIVVPAGQVAVLGDCSSVSVDSRVWGPLPRENIVGRPIVRLWPPSRFGAISSLPSARADWSE